MQLQELQQKCDAQEKELEFYRTPRKPVDFVVPERYRITQNDKETQTLLANTDDIDADHNRIVAVEHQLEQVLSELDQITKQSQKRERTLRKIAEEQDQTRTKPESPAQQRQQMKQQLQSLRQLAGRSRSGTRQRAQTQPRWK